MSQMKMSNEDFAQFTDMVAAAQKDGDLSMWEVLLDYLEDHGVKRDLGWFPFKAGDNVFCQQVTHNYAGTIRKIVYNADSTPRMVVLSPAWAVNETGPAENLLAGNFKDMESLPSSTVVVCLDASNAIFSIDEWKGGKKKK
jgi:hypothetical protein